MSDSAPADPPSPFVVEWAARLAGRVPAPRRALDLAMGRGRHALVLAASGYRVFGVDRNLSAVRDAVRRTRAAGLVLRAWCADLTVAPLPAARFELIVVTRYLQRDRFEALAAALVPGGVLLYETFTEAQRVHGTGPTSPDHLLKAGELGAAFAALDTIFSEEVQEPAALARLVARRP